MGKGVANVWRYYQVNIASNHRYLDALAAAPLKGKGVAALDALCRSRIRNGRHHARFNPLSPADRALFRAVLAGGHATTGFRNRSWLASIRAHPPTPKNPIVAAHASPVSSPSCAATASSPRFPALASTVPPATATGS
jgi:hypothetical protein